MKIHVQTWQGSGSAQITDMTNAGKNGKVCRVVRVQGWYNTTCGSSETHPEAAKAHRQTGRVMAYLAKLATGDICGHACDMVEADFDAVVKDIAAILSDDDATSHVTIQAGEIKGIKAPRPVLTAGIQGKFSASADEEGITICDHVDQHNLPKMITPHGQTGNKAYKLAAKVWAAVEKATSFREAGDILSAAGCRLHYYCSMD